MSAWLARLSTRARVVLAASALVALVALVLQRVLAARVGSQLGAEGEAAMAELRFAVLVGFVSAVASALFVSAVAAVYLTGRLRRLTDTALAMSNGDLGRRAEAGGNDEVGQLGAALNKLAGELSNSIGDIRDDRDLLANILDGMGEGVLVTDGEEKIVLANRALRAMGVVPEDAVGRSIFDAFKKNAPVLSLLEEGATAESVVRELEVGRVVLRKLRVRVSRLTGDDGGLVAVFHDVTDLRRLETIRTDFVANVSHELRTPVTAIGTAAETLLMGALDSPSDAQEFVELIDRNAKRLRELVDDLLDLSKIEAKNFRVVPADVEVWPIIVHTAKLLQDHAKKRHIQVTTAIAGDGTAAPETVRAHVDKKALEQVLMNLLDNAIKYAGEGARVQMVLHPGGNPGDAVSIAVMDNGAGIAPVHVERIFERFYRVDTGRSRELGSTGLGLSIVKHLMELMGGTIGVESELGKGSTFTIRVRPAVGEPASSAAA